MPPTIFFSQKKPKTTKRMSSRRQRPLHACGVSILAIADIALGKTQQINGPIGSTLRKIAKLAKFVTPLIYAMQYLWLAILSFIDDRILSAEKLTEKLFPPSTYAFDKIDNVVVIIMSLPDKFDGAVNKFPTIIHQIPLLEWTLALVISRLNRLASTLNHWGDENSGVVNEKTIGVDSNCNNEHLESVERTDSFPPIPEAENKGVIDVAVPSTHVKGSYKEALEKGKEKSIDMESENKIYECDEKGEKNDDGYNNDEGYDESVVKYQDGRSESMKDDPLLDLFESAWLMKSSR